MSGFSGVREVWEIETDATLGLLLNNVLSSIQMLQISTNNRTACFRHKGRKTTVLSCHRCLLNTGVEKMNYI